MKGFKHGEATFKRGGVIIMRRPRKDYRLEYEQSQQNTVLLEEFPEGPYGASIYNEQELGKSTPWQPGQAVTNRFFDENPAFTDDLARPKNAKLPDL